MENQPEISQQNPPEPLNETSVTSPPAPSKLPLILLVVLLLFLSGVGGISLGKYLSVSQNLPPVPTLVPKPTMNPTTPPNVPANWKTHTVDNILSFKYPPSFIIKNPISGVVNISDSEKNFTPANLFITVDTRLIGSYANYYEAVRVGTEKLPKDSKIQDLPNGIKITWNLGAVLEQNKNHYATLEYLKYKEGAVTIQYNDDLNGPRIYDQILSTFKFL